MNGDTDLDDLLIEGRLAEDEWLQESAAEFVDPLTTGLVGAAGRAIFGAPRRSPLSQVRTGGGVGTARLNTPRGSATLQLPSKVPTIEQFKALETAVNRNTLRLNSVAGDMDVVKKQATELVRVRRDQGSQSMMNLVVGMMTQQQFRDDLEAHTHAVGGAAIVPDDRNSMTMMLPLMMMGGSGGSGGDDNMMLMMMMMMMMRD
jgi:hypothetical protein